jgi:hypothetical protein
MKTDNREKQTNLAVALARMAMGVGEEMGLSGAEIIEATVYGLAMTCCDMTSPENRSLCVNEAAKLLSTYATPVTVTSPLQSLATH